jgi:hypothetical protein
MSKGVKCHKGIITVWEEGPCETNGKNVTEWKFCHNPGLKRWSLCQSYIFVHPQGWVGIKTLLVYIFRVWTFRQVASFAS